MTVTKGVFATVVALAGALGCANEGSQTAEPPFHIDRSGLANVGTTTPLDYSNPNLWVCKPGIDANPCYGDHGELDSTELLPDGTRMLVRHVRALEPKFDCFYVYPTVYLSGMGNQTNLSDISYVLDALMAQGARLSELCEVYAPLYRQVILTPGAATDGLKDASTAAPMPASSGGAGLLSGSNAALALGDVRNAFKYYLDHFNNGRKFVLMGHSQGSGMLIGMMQQDVDPMPDVRVKMISALLIGGGATVAANSTIGGTFKNIPACSRPGETGCMVAYSIYDSASPPGDNALFGRAPAGQEAACNNPSLLAGNSAAYKASYFPVHLANMLLAPSNPVMDDPGTAFRIYRGVFQGQCKKNGPFSYLESTLVEAMGDPRGVPPYLSAGATSLGFGLHLVDWALPMRDLIDDVTQQAAVAVP
jgi:hypothetical protein